MVTALSIDLRFLTSSRIMASYSSKRPLVSSPSSCIAALMWSSSSLAKSDLYSSFRFFALLTARRSWSVTLTGSSGVDPMALRTTASLFPLATSARRSSATLVSLSGPATHVPPNFQTVHSLSLSRQSEPPTTFSSPARLAHVVIGARRDRAAGARDRGVGTLPPEEEPTPTRVSVFVALARRGSRWPRAAALRAAGAPPPATRGFAWAIKGWERRPRLSSRALCR